MKSLKKKKIGLALGGGAALGGVHIGVLRALKKLEIKIDYISGTSVGALAACLHAFGVDCDEVEHIALETSWSDFSDLSLSKYGFMSNDKMKKLLKVNIGEPLIEDASIPLSIVATDISAGEKVVFRKGDAATAVMASSCIPGIFKPVNIGDRLLVDGGIVENVPVSPLLEHKPDAIIAVDLNSNGGYREPGNIFDVLLNSFHLTLDAISRIQTNKADIVIRPDLSDFNKIDVEQTPDLIQIGYEETMSILNS